MDRINPTAHRRQGEEAARTRRSIAVSVDKDGYQIEMEFEGWYSRISCGACGEMFEVEDDVQSGQQVECDACGAAGIVRRSV